MDKFAGMNVVALPGPEWGGVGPLLDPYGDGLSRVGLVEKMGSDQRIVGAARVSYQKGTKSVNQDRGLIRYLLRHKHTSPFEMADTIWVFRMPIFVARQWVRHRTASINEESARYSELRDDFFIPKILRKQSKSNKQGSDGVLFGTDYLEEMQGEQKFSHRNYTRYLKSGMAKELARINLPLSIYTNFYWKANLLNVMRFLKLRMDQHAQYEIRVLAEAMYHLLKDHYPLVMEAFEDYWLNAIEVSREEWSMLNELLDKPALERMILNRFLNGKFAQGETLELLNRYGVLGDWNMDRLKALKEGEL